LYSISKGKEAISANLKNNYVQQVLINYKLVVIIRKYGHKLFHVFIVYWHINNYNIIVKQNL